MALACCLVRSPLNKLLGRLKIMTSATSSTRSSASVRRGQGRVANVALWAAQVVAAIAFLMAAAMKLSGAAPAVAAFDAIGLGDWFRYLMAALEIAGAVALLIPVLSGLAGLAFVGLMVGAIATHLFVVGDGAAPLVVYLLLAAVIAWGRRSRTAELVDVVRRTK